MPFRGTLRAAFWAAAVSGLLLPAGTGCALLNGFLDPTKVGQFPREYQERGIKRILTPRDAPIGPENAAEPTPEDLVPIYEDYRLAPGDVVGVVIQDLVAPGAPEQAVLEVSATGNIRVPLLGSVHVAGLTEAEIEEELKTRFREANLLPDPDVRVYAQTKRTRTFVIRGSVGAAGLYQIPQPDTRLLDVIGQARDIGSNVPKLYVIRRPESDPGYRPAGQEGPAEEPEILIPPPEEEDEGGVATFSTSAGLGQGTSPEPATQAAPAAELEEVFATQPASQPAGEMVPPPLEPLVFNPKTGALMETPAEGRSETAAPDVVVTEEEPLEEPFDWEDVPELELQQRVIEIDTRALLNGDPRYNIVIRDRDVINVPVDTGVYYLMGEVARPGVYAFNGRDVTITRAIASSGGLSPFAWPMRCEIIRHEPGTDKQLTIPVNLDAIFAGLADDVYLRDDDIVNVGTHFVAPFLFVIRNSFRFTYGFGFVYDRNFADKDSYGAKINPANIQNRNGLPF